VSASQPLTGDELAAITERCLVAGSRRSEWVDAAMRVTGEDVPRLVAEVERLRAQVEQTYQDGIHRGRRVVPDPERFPAPWPDYAMRTAQGHPPIPEQARTLNAGQEA
jgi:hypothetical protein